jgi:hypothetical protein
MRFNININGDDANTIRDDYRRIVDECTDVKKALLQAMPNKRNYQTNEDPDGDWESDRAEVLAQLAKIEDVISWAITAGARAVRQREGI